MSVGTTGENGFYNPGHILLIGFMGSGKSTAARRLARKYGKVSFDTDIGICRMLNKTVPEIFEDEGEQGFREHEYEYLKYLMGVDSAIVSCGGGIVTYEKSRELLKHLGFVVFMEVDPDEALGRIHSTVTRPLLNKDTAHDLLQSRMPLYLESCDMRFDTTGKRPVQVCNELGAMLEERGLL